MLSFSILYEYVCAELLQCACICKMTGTEDYLRINIPSLLLDKDKPET